MSRTHAAAAALALAVAALAATFLVHPGIDSLYDDSVSYLLMAQWYSPWHAASPAVAAAARLQTYPPLFPLALALSGGAYDWRIAHLLVAAAFGASVFLLGVHARRTTGSMAAGLLAAAAFAALPGAWLNARGILSEFPYIALSLGALAWHARMQDDARIRPRDAAILGLLLAAAILTRTIGIALIAAVAVSEAARFARTRDTARLRGAWIAPAIAIAAALAWQLLRPAAAGDSYAASTRLMLAGAESGPLAWARAWAVHNGQAISDAWFTALLIFWGEPWRPTFLLAAALGVLGLAGAAARALRGEADALYVLGFLAILLFWPFPGQMYRLAFPVAPLVLLLALRTVAALLSLRFDAARAARTAAYSALVPIALGLPALLFYVVPRAHVEDAPVAGYRITDIAEFYRIPSGPSARESARTQIGVLADMERVRESTPAGARVMWYTPGYIALLAGRDGVALRRPRDAADLDAQVRATRADYLYLADAQPRDSLHREGDPLYPAVLARAFAEPVWARTDEGRLRAVLMKIDKEKTGSVRRP
jgi:hypothetical protein